MATNLFAPLQANNKAPLVEFKAGKCTFANNKVTPDKKKGLIQLTQNADSLIQFLWKDRTSGNTELDLIIFPEEATFKRISQCTTGRVYLLEFKASGKKHFFWCQDAKEDKDEENCNKINQYINNPPAPEQGQGAAPGFGGLDQAALFQMLGGGRGLGNLGGSGGASGGSSAAAANPSIAMNDLQSILTGMGVPASTFSNLMQAQQANQPSQPAQQGASQPAQSAQPAQQSQARETPLSQIINADSVIPLIMGNPEIVNQLLPLLPEERRTPEEIQSVLRSPQFQQSLDVFASALQSGQLTDMIRQFNIQTSGGPQSIESFLMSLQNQANQNRSSSGQSGEKDKKDDKMDTN